MTSEAGEKGDRELDWADHADQGRGMDRERECAISVADNACESGPSTVAEEENFGASPELVQGMEGEKKSDVALKAERKSDTEEDGHKTEVSSSRGDGVTANITTTTAVQDPESPIPESSPDRPLSRPRRSDASRPGLRKLNTSAKTRSSSLTSQRSSAANNHHNHSGGTRKRGEDGEDLRQASSSEDGDEGDEVDGTGYRCGICNEDFESAKSLSLHKKYHPQYTLRRNPKRSRKLIDQEYAVDAAAGAQAPPVQTATPTAKKTSSMSEEFPRPCTECGKEFASWKALFGHMRCHPEREWRGIQPPAEKSSNPEGQGSANFRRKKPAPQLPPPAAPSVITFQGDNEKSGSLDSKRAHVPDNESDTESIEAAYMSNGDRHTVMGWMTGKRSKRSRQTHRSLDAVNNAKKELSARDSATVMTESNDMIEALMLLHAADKEKLTLPVTPESYGRKSRSKSRTPESGLEAEAEELSAEKRVKVEADAASPCGDTEDGGDEFEAGEQGTSARSKYECATCKRQFKSHQALGGHRASHKKVKGCFARTNVSEGGAHEQSVDSMEGEDEEQFLKSEEQLQLLPNELQETSHNNSEEGEKPCYLTTARDDNEEMLSAAARKAKAHECSICHRVFTSGQALGGHKRCHWGGGSGIPCEVTSSVKVTGQQSRSLKEGVQLDLNLPAPECLLEEEEMEAGISPMRYMPAGPGLSFFNIMNNNSNNNNNNSSSRNTFGDTIVEHEDEPNPVEGINQFSNFDSRAFGPLDTIKPHVVLVPGLTPTSA